MAISLISPLRDIPLAFVDVETNGRSARRGDRVIEIGIVRVERGAVSIAFSDTPATLARVDRSLASLSEARKAA